MRVLHFIPSFWIGGIETLFMQWYRASESTDCRIDLLSYEANRESKLLEEFITRGGVSYKIKAFSTRHYLEYCLNVKDFFSVHNNYDILHMHGDMDYTVIKNAKKSGISKIIFHAHSICTYPNNSKNLKTRILSIYYDAGRKYIDYYLACSTEAGDSTFGNKKYTVIKNAIDVYKFSFNPNTREKIRKNLKIENSLVVGHVGRMVSDKNYDFLFSVFLNIKKAVSNSVLLIIGDGPERKHVESLIAYHNLTKSVVLLGISESVSEYYQAMDIFLFPSLREGFGIAAIEAQTSGLPCIMSDNVPKDVAVTACSVRISLDEEVNAWANVALKLSRMEREDKSKQVAEKGFDYHKEFKKLLSIYKDITYNEKEEWNID